MFSCYNSDLKLLLQVEDERRICIVISAAGSSAGQSDESDESVEYG
jgi:hypothetical protein